MSSDRGYTIETKECKYCGRDIAKSQLNVHMKACRKDDFESLPLLDEIEEAPHHVYIMTILVEDVMMIYVGYSSHVIDRLRGHVFGDQKFSVPFDGEMQSKEYEVISINRVISVEGGRKRAAFRERELFLRLANICSEDIVVGGK